MKRLALFLAALASVGAADAALPAPPPTDPSAPAVAQGASFFGFPERFNRYYTDPHWRPARTLFVSSDGTGDGTTRDTPMAADAAIDAARPGTKIVFKRGQYLACYEFTGENAGSYDEPVVVTGERNEDGSIGVVIQCCGERRGSCFNIEGGSYVAIDGFELIGGTYGVRAVGAGFQASEHARGIAVMNSTSHDQEKDPFFSGHTDWSVWEKNKAFGAKEGDGHGIYLSNGGDWNIVRFNETYGNVSSDFQINADPASTCAEDGIAFDDLICDAYAGTGEGGRGASDYFLVDANYFHHGDGPGANFTSVRRSVIRNNVFGPSARHNVSFWQETENPRLGSSENVIVNNLFVTTDRHGVQFTQFSDRNEFANNIILGLSIADGTAKANPDALLMEVDETVAGNAYLHNLYVGGTVEGRTPNRDELVLEEFSTDWFAEFPISLGQEVAGFAPTMAAPFVSKGVASPYASADRDGNAREAQVDLGPYQSH